MKKIFILFFTLFIITIILSYIYRSFEFNNFKNKIEDEFINLDEFYIYGTHLNIKGSSNINFKNISDVKLLLKSKDDEIRYELNYNLDNYLIFSLSSNINEGINLEKLNNGNYYVLLEIINNKDKKYYSFKNNTKYNPPNYYSISNNNKTNKIEIKFDKYMTLNSKNISIPDNIYDIVIDAGHGGIDSGAINGKYYESKLTLKYAKELKKKLEMYGYKVKLTREDDISINTYGKNSRTSISYDVKAKYLFSIHFNSSEKGFSYNGVEIYTPPKINLSLANNLVKNIVKNLDLNYSTNKSFKKEDGIYIRTLSENDLKNMKNEALQNGYKMYNVSTSTPYLYILRETGGFMAGAYVDGRNKKYDKNLYVNSNYGAESYLLELGYINNSHDLNIILNNKDKYMNIVADTINEYIKSNS